jgi:hypothetical protein
VAEGCAYFRLQVKAINCISPCLCPVLTGFNSLPAKEEQENRGRMRKRSRSSEKNKRDTHVELGQERERTFKFGFLESPDFYLPSVKVLKEINFITFSAFWRFFFIIKNVAYQIILSL